MIKIQECLASCSVFRPQLLQANEAFNLVSPIAEPDFLMPEPQIPAFLFVLMSWITS